MHHTEPLCDETGDNRSGGGAEPSWRLRTVARVRRRRTRQTSTSAAPIPLAFVRTTLDAQRHVRAACGQLVWFVPLLLAFLFLFYAERDIEGDYYSGSAVKLAFTEAALPPVDLSSTPLNQTFAAADRNPYSRWSYYDNAQERGDGYVALKQLLLPLLFPPQPEREGIFNITTNPLGGGSPSTLSAFPDSLRVMLGGAVQTVGPVRLRSKHVRGHTCDVDSKLFSNSHDAIAFFNDHCYAPWSDGDEATSWFSLGAVPWSFTRFGCHSSFVSGFLTLFGLVHNYNCGGFVVDLPFGTTSLDAARSVADAMSTERFQNGLHVRLFQVEWFSFRGSGDVFFHASLYTEMTVGGGWNVRAEVTPFRLAHKSAGWIVYATLIACCFVGMTVVFVGQAVVHASTRGSVLSSFLLLPWNLVELANLVAFYVWFGFYCVWWSLSREHHAEFQTIEARDAVSAFPLRLLELRQIYWTTVYLNALNVLFLFLKFLKFLRLNARINVLQRTIVASARSILSVVALLCLFVLAYSIAGMLLYGSVLFEYRNFPEAWATTFRALIGGFDYGAMQAAYRGATFVYFWSLMVFGVFVLLNFCMAILMQHFDEQCSASQLPPVSVSLRLAWESFVYYAHREGALNVMRDALFAAAWQSRDNHLAASILVERAAKRKLLDAKRLPSDSSNKTSALDASMEDQHQQGGGSFNNASFRGDSVNPSASQSVEDTALAAPSAFQRTPDAVSLNPPDTTATATTLLGGSRRSSIAPKGFHLDDAPRRADSGGEAVLQGGREVVADDDISFSMTSSARKHRPSLVELQSPPSQQRRASRTTGGGAVDRAAEGGGGDGLAPSCGQPTPSTPAQAVDPLRPTPRGVGRRRSSTIERIHRAWRRSTLRKAERQEDLEVVEMDIKALSSANDCILISFSDLVNEMKSVARRIVQVDALLAGLKTAAAARGGSPPHCAPEDEETHPFPAPGSIEATASYQAALLREQRLLRTMQGIPDEDLSTIWCRLYDDFEGTDAAQKITQQQDRTRVIQASVARAVSTALMPLRRRLFLFSNTPAAPAASLSRASLKTGAYSAFAGDGSDRLAANPGLQLSVGSVEEYDSPSSMTPSTTLVADPSSADLLSGSMDPSSGAQSHHAAVVSRRRPRAGSILASTLFPTSEEDPTTRTAADVALAAPRLTNGGTASSVAQSLTDMETHLGAMNVLLEGTIAQLVSVTSGTATASPSMV